jgi:hypothetical protein
MSTLSPAEEEVKKLYWSNEDAQKLLRSLIRLGEGHPSVAYGDIMDDLHEAGHQPIENMKTLLDQFCDNDLIVKCEQDTKNDYNVPLFYVLTPFLNPEMGDVPDEDDFSLSSNAESSGSSEDNPIIVQDSDDDDSSDSIGDTFVVGSDQSMHPRKRRIHRQGSKKSPRESPKTNFYHSQFVGTELYDQSDTAISSDDDQA